MVQKCATQAFGKKIILIFTVTFSFYNSFFNLILNEILETKIILSLKDRLWASTKKQSLFFYENWEKIG